MPEVFTHKSRLAKLSISNLLNTHRIVSKHHVNSRVTQESIQSLGVRLTVMRIGFRD